MAAEFFLRAGLTGKWDDEFKDILIKWVLRQFCEETKIRDIIDRIIRMQRTFNYETKNMYYQAMSIQDFLNLPYSCWTLYVKDYEKITQEIENAK